MDKRSSPRRDVAFWLLGVMACNQPTPERNGSVAESLQESKPVPTQAVAPRTTPHTGLEALEPWRERVPLDASDERCGTTLAELANHDPELLLALGWLREKQWGASGTDCTSPTRLEQALRLANGFDACVRLIEQPERWDFSEALPWNDHWRSRLLVIAVHLKPASRRELLSRWAMELQRPNTELIREYMAQFPLPQVPRHWLAELEPCDARAPAIFDGVRQLDAATATRLLQILDTHGGEWHVVGPLTKTLIRLGAPPARFRCTNDLGGGCKMSVERAKRVELACLQCVTAARAWLTQWRSR